MKPLGDILSPLIKQRGLEDGVRFEALKKAWPSLFREPLSLHVYPASLENGELLITVDSPVWLQQLTYLKDEIVRKLEQFRVQRVRFRIGRIRSRKAFASSQSIQRPAALLDDETLRQINDLVSTVKDSGIREGVRHAMERSLAHRRKR